jgi:predicted metal-dependent hydrolase
MNDIAVRKLVFDFPADVDLVFVEDDPELSYTFLGTWFMLPYLEPYLMRTMNEAIQHIKDPAQAEEMRRFVQQEGQHHQQHGKANEALRALNPVGYAKLKDLEAEMAAEFKAFSKTKSLKFNLAYAEGFECMTSAASAVQIETGMFAKPGNPLRALALWHVMEELEHRNVAFEAYQACGGGYLYRLFAGIWAQAHFLKWGKRLTKVMKDADQHLFAKYDNPESKARRDAFRKRYWKAALPRWLAIYTPWYSPRKLKLPSNFDQTRQRFTDMATSVN